MHSDNNLVPNQPKLYVWHELDSLARNSSLIVAPKTPVHHTFCFYFQLLSFIPYQDEFDNLFAMEIDPSKELKQSDITQNLLGMQDHGFGDILSNIPGIDEAMALFQLMKQVDDDESKYDIVIFDTAPTGHTLNLLRAPSTLKQFFEKFGTIKDKFGGILSSVTSMLGAGGSNDESELGFLEKIEEMQVKVDAIEKRFQDPDYTTFICVAIPEFLSLFETERLVQELTVLGIDVQNIVVNQILFPDECSECRKCKARIKMQSKYLDQMELLYIDFHLIKMPLLDQEVRGKAALELFGQMLITGKPNPLALTMSDE